MRKLDAVPPAVLVVIAAALWGTTGTSQALGPDGTTPLGVGLVRLAVGAVGLLVVARASSAPSRGNPWWTLAGGIAIGIYQLAFFVGVERLGVAVGTLVGIGSAPLFTGLGAALLDRELTQLRWVLRVAPVPVLGVLLLVGPDLGRAELDLVGVLGAMGAGASYAAYTLVSRRLLDEGVAPVRLMAQLFTIGTVVTAVVVVAQSAPLSWLGTARGAGIALWLGLGATTAAYVCFGMGLRRVAPARVATLTLTEPLTATLLGVLVLGERLAAVQTVGILAVVAGLAIAGRVAIGSDPSPATT